MQIERANWSYFSKACILPIASKKASAVVPFCIKSKSKSTPRTFKSLDSHWPPGMGMKGTSKPLVPKMRISWRQNWQREIKYPEEEEEKKYIFECSTSSSFLQEILSILYLFIFWIMHPSWVRYPKEIRIWSFSIKLSYAYNLWTL